MVDSTATNQDKTSTAFWEETDKEQFLAYAFTMINLSYTEQRKRTAEAAVVAINESFDSARNKKYGVIVVQKRKRFGIWGTPKETSREEKELTAFEINKILQARNPLEEILPRGEGYGQYEHDSQENQRVRGRYPNIRYNIHEALKCLPSLGMFSRPFSQKIDYIGRHREELSERTPSRWGPLDCFSPIFPADFLNAWNSIVYNPKEHFNYGGQGTAFEQLRGVNPKLYENIMSAEKITWKPILKPTRPAH